MGLADAMCFWFLSNVNSAPGGRDVVDKSMVCDGRAQDRESRNIASGRDSRFCIQETWLATFETVAAHPTYMIVYRFEYFFGSDQQ